MSKSDSSKRVSFFMPNDLYDLLKFEAEKIGIPVTGLINVAVKEYLKQGSVIDMVELFKNTSLPAAIKDFKTGDE